jgi:hypothetical protein
VRSFLKESAVISVARFAAALSTPAIWHGSRITKARCRTRRKIKRRLRTVDQRDPRGALSDTQAGIPEIDNSSAVTGHELAEIDLAALGRELLEKLDLLILQEMLIGT